MCANYLIQTKPMNTIRQIGEYHRVSHSTIQRLKSEGVNVMVPWMVEKAILSQHIRPKSWENGNPNRPGVRLPSSCSDMERDNPPCFCKPDDEGSCVACLGEWWFNPVESS